MLLNTKYSKKNNKIYYIFRLKRLQIVDIMTKRFTFSKINFSIPADDFLDVINEFNKDLEPDTALVFFWIDDQQEYITEIITPYGLCYTFHIAFSHDLLYVNSTSDDFHYQYTLRHVELPHNRNRPPKKFPKKISTSELGLWVGFGYYDDEIPYLQQATTNPLSGHVVMVHNPFELPTWNSPVFKYSLKLQTRILIDLQKNSIDESLYEYEPFE